MEEMQDNKSIREDTSQHSQVFETDYDLLSKPTTAKTGLQQVLSRPPIIQADPIISPKVNQRQTKSKGYAPPASSRESWWRVTIKVQSNFDHSSFFMRVLFRIHPIRVL